MATLNYKATFNYKGGKKKTRRHKTKTMQINVSAPVGKFGNNMKFNDRQPRINVAFIYF